MIRPQISKRRPRKARSNSTTGSAIPGWCFSRIPKDFTPVCTTELGYMARIKPEFDKRGVHHRSLGRPSRQARRLGGRYQGDAGLCTELPDDRRRRLQCVEALRHLHRSISAIPPSAQRPTTRRCATFSSWGKNKIKLILVYPMTTGRNFDEVLRVINSLQLTAKHKVATPVNWKNGEDVIIAGSVNDDDAKKQYPQGWKAPKPYLRRSYRSQRVAASDIGAAQAPSVSAPAARWPFSMRRCRPGYGRPKRGQRPARPAPPWPSARRRHGRREAACWWTW